MFNTINHIIFDKKGEMTNELLEEFSPYMVTRYLSFYDKDLLNYANETVNKYSSIFETDEERFRFFENVIPKLKQKRIDYISKKKNSQHGT
jgi:hypothetical protein